MVFLPAVSHRLNCILSCALGFNWEKSLNQLWGHWEQSSGNVHMDGCWIFCKLERWLFQRRKQKCPPWVEVSLGHSELMVSSSNQNRHSFLWGDAAFARMLWLVKEALTTVEGTTWTSHPKTSVMGITVIITILPKPAQYLLYVRASVSRDCLLQHTDLTIHRNRTCFLIGVGGTVSQPQFAQKTKPKRGVWMQGFILETASTRGGRVGGTKRQKDDQGTLLSCSVLNSNRIQNIAWPSEETLGVFQDCPPQVGERSMSCPLDPNSWH